MLDVRRPHAAALVAVEGLPGLGQGLGTAELPCGAVQVGEAMLAL